ncbi:MarR family transcriptional regulator [Nocardia cyriacigeorgica]|uniref:MarR family transcriptional regulator n=1 Tax=Nocardia cyriacigeorgica TaxID=135487 RepID=A0A6P1CYW3_9NOCA|nr:MarR family transcriptional regulator [Nocardia cyriacigeorgica]NEW37723.1 MarR family transcriptional regulator [Nocardia cyriacigeorgica]NEW43315.1 MarR family transcriptional regulator [Nocardia cyriacigeorgica]NEW48891.1 MarR family transcriptional regulator [Nocardia cyriacigeorgica]NEW56105.1 MarR family transcriptional regulator [Nocardia cyriacigeorgica]
MSSEPPPRLEVDRLQNSVVGFVRAFGLHQPDTTPCGQTVPVSQAYALTELAMRQPINQSELGMILRLSKGTVSRMVGLMERRGWVERVRGSAADGRMVLLRLTDTGEDMAANIAAARRARMETFLDRIPAAQRDAVMQSLSILIEAADDH